MIVYHGRNPPTVHKRMFSDIASVPSLPVWNQENEIAVMMGNKPFMVEAIHIIYTLPYQAQSEVALLVHGEESQ